MLGTERQIPDLKALSLARWEGVWGLGGVEADIKKEIPHSEMQSLHGGGELRPCKQHAAFGLVQRRLLE